VDSITTSGTRQFGFFQELRWLLSVTKFARDHEIAPGLEGASANAFMEHFANFA